MKERNGPNPRKYCRRITTDSQKEDLIRSTQGKMEMYSSPKGCILRVAGNLNHNISQRHYPMVDTCLLYQLGMLMSIK
jgi:hypothetical protein